MNATNTGLLAGLVLGTAAALGGLGAFFLALVIGIIGFVVGRVLDGDLDLNALLGRSGPVTHPDRNDPGGDDPAGRGRLDISSTVLRKIVEHAADSTPGTLRHERRVAGIDIGTAGAGAKVSDGPDGVVDVALELTLQYPASVRGTVDAVRARVSDELRRIAGRRVRNLAVTVSGLRGADDGTGTGPRVQ